MNADYLKDFRKLSHDDEMRYKLLMWEVKNLLSDKQSEGYLKKIMKRWPRKKQRIKAGTW
ncbi:hypothetical protein EBB07_08690 [Paenibacillaceae bacterium]|nr:hypothetical protein EBB07_08690 [Paenibacillaceae bacterium]